MKEEPPSPPPISSSPSGYAGRWVALVHGRIIAQGGTPRQARLAAKKSRPKETPDIRFMPYTPTPVFPPLLETILAALPDDSEIYLVGGATRDALIGRASHDLDFVLPRDALSIARKVANRLGAAFYPLDETRETARVILIHEDGTRDAIDFAVFRGNSLDEDLQRRDFTLNAIAWNPRAQTLYDPLGGAEDLHKKRLRACAPDSFERDPLRVLRGVRLAASLGLHILPETRAAMKVAAPRLSEISPERRRDEVFHILGGKSPASAIRALDLLDALPSTLPELPALKGVSQSPPHVSDVWEHTLQTMQALEEILDVLAPAYNEEKSADLLNGLLTLRLGRYRNHFAEHFSRALTMERSRRSLLFFAALYHDIAKPQTRREEDGRIRFFGHDAEGANQAALRASAFRLSGEEIAALRRIIRHHMRIHFHVRRMHEEGKPPSRRAIYRFFRDTGEEGVDVILLSLADTRATWRHTLPQELWASALDVSRILLENWWEKPQETVAPPALLDGSDLLKEFSLSPGPLIGEILRALREAQATGEVKNREDALAFCQAFLEERDENG